MSYNRLQEDGGRRLLEDGGFLIQDTPLYFAQINGSSVVTRVIVVYASDLQSGIFGDPASFIGADIEGSHGKYPAVGDSWDVAQELFIFNP